MTLRGHEDGTHLTLETLDTGDQAGGCQMSQDVTPGAPVTAVSPAPALDVVLPASAGRVRDPV